MQIARANRQLLAEVPFELDGHSLSEMRVWSRRECLEASQRWMTSILGTPSPELPTDDQLLFATGHQPQLNHAGVWMKNVAVSAMARSAAGVGLNLIVDNDVASRQTVTIPAGTAAQPQFGVVAYDDPQPQQPWEALRIQNRPFFESFAERVDESIAPWGLRSTLSSTWPEVVELSRRQNSLAVCLSACRHLQEAEWGLQNFELPISELSQTAPFLAFIAHFCRHHEQLFEIYNSAVHDYRRRHKIRNLHHPVPDLKVTDGWFEIPFWIWKSGDLNRRRLLVRRVGQVIELGTRDGKLAELPVAAGDNIALTELQQHYRLRPRAITTTLFSRLCLSDLFVHGIGGAKYDEIADFFLTQLGITPPRFLTLTATLHLPVESATVSESDLRQLRRLLRELKTQGDSTDHSDEAEALRQLRSSLLDEARLQRSLGLSKKERRSRRTENRARHLRLKEIQHALVTRAAERIAAVQQQIDDGTRQLAANRVLKSREYAAVLFPESQLRELVERTSSMVVCQRRQNPQANSH
ncbi:hypothetical protein [Planctomicrobium sp. SH664]|uniref:hypothetical protein n=1 Tax=Planctomicrobium sp. SH664 TaxID=3448125 RepID=UPI003F5BCE3D